jgi:hypothetical protein
VEDEVSRGGLRSWSGRDSNPRPHLGNVIRVLLPCSTLVYFSRSAARFAKPRVTVSTPVWPPLVVETWWRCAHSKAAGFVAADDALYQRNWTSPRLRPGIWTRSSCTRATATNRAVAEDLAALRRAPARDGVDNLRARPLVHRHGSLGGLASVARMRSERGPRSTPRSSS